MSKVIGIDLGTTNSCVAVMEGGEAVVIPNAEGNRTTPSVVAFSKTGERMVGQVAKRQAITNPDRTISSIKREMGSDYKVTIDSKSYTPQEISAMILQKLKADAEAYLGSTVTEAVITVPAYFTDSQRQATKDAGRIAGLDVKRIINEPTAAALAYGVDKEQSQKIMVYDLGGGTFDVSILDIDDGVIEVLATAGNNRLGGDDFDECIMKWLVSEFKRTDGVDLSTDRVAMQRLKEAAEKAKIELSGVTTSNINLPYITADANGPKHLDVTLSRAKFNELTAHLVDATMGPVRQAMSDAGLKPSDLSKVLLVGGSSRIPAVQEAVKNFTGNEPFKGINPDECVAMGAALQAGVLTGDVKGLLLLDVTPLSLGIETMGVFATSSPCPKCGGKGRIIHQPCKDCRGSGMVRKKKTIQASIPAGIDNGQTISIRGQGNAGKNGGPAGDLLITITVRPHELFRREGTSVLCEAPITFTQAVLGAELEIPTIDGKVKYTLPEGTQSGTTFRLKGKGIPSINGRGRGDQYVTVYIETPKNLNKEQKEALKKFAETMGESNYEEQKKFFKKFKK